MGQGRRDIARSLERLGDLLESSIQAYAQQISKAQPPFKWLNAIAQLRFALAVSADYLCMYVADTPEKRALNPRGRMMMDQFVALLSGCLQRPELQDLSLYLAKQIARRHGMIILKRLYNQGHEFVLPPSLQQSQVRHWQDYHSYSKLQLILHDLCYVSGICRCNQEFQTCWCCLVIATVKSEGPLCKH